MAQHLVLPNRIFSFFVLFSLPLGHQKQIQSKMPCDNNETRLKISDSSHLTATAKIHDFTVITSIEFVFKLQFVNLLNIFCFLLICGYIFNIFMNCIRWWNKARF